MNKPEWMPINPCNSCANAEWIELIENFYDLCPFKSNCKTCVGNMFGLYCPAWQELRRELRGENG